TVFCQSARCANARRQFEALDGGHWQLHYLLIWRKATCVCAQREKASRSKPSWEEALFLNGKRIHRIRTDRSCGQHRATSPFRQDVKCIKIDSAQQHKEQSRRKRNH